MSYAAVRDMIQQPPLPPLEHWEQQLLSAVRLVRAGRKTGMVIVRWDGSAIQVHEAGPPRRIAIE